MCVRRSGSLITGVGCAVVGVCVSVLQVDFFPPWGRGAFYPCEAAGRRTLQGRVCRWGARLSNELLSLSQVTHCLVKESGPVVGALLLPVSPSLPPGGNFHSKGGAKACPSNGRAQA